METKIYTNGIQTNKPMKEVKTDETFFEWLMNEKNHQKIETSMSNWEIKQVRSKLKVQKGKLAFSGVIEGDLKRNKQNVKLVKNPILDLDDLTTEYQDKEKLVSFLEQNLGFAFVLWESVSSGLTNEDGITEHRYKLAAELDEPIDNELHQAFIETVSQKLVSEGVLEEVDTSNKQLYQMQIAPTHSPSNEMQVSLHNEHKGSAKVQALKNDVTLKNDTENTQDFEPNYDGVDFSKSFQERNGIEPIACVKEFVSKHGEKLEERNYWVGAMIELDFSLFGLGEVSIDQAKEISDLFSVGKYDNDRSKQENREQLLERKFNFKEYGDQPAGIEFFYKVVSGDNEQGDKKFFIENFLNDINIFEDGTTVVFEQLNSDGTKTKVEKEINGKNDNLQSAFLKEYAYYQRRNKAQQKKALQIANVASAYQDEKKASEKIAEIQAKPLGEFEEKLTVNKMAEILMKAFPFVLLENFERANADGQPVYVYDFSEGYYTSSESLINRFIEAIDPESTKNTKAEVYEKLRLRAGHLPQYNEGRYSWVNNGIFDQKTKELLPFTYDMVKTGKIKTDYNPKYSGNAPAPSYNDGYGGWNAKDGLMEIANNDPQIYELLLQVINTSSRNVSMGKCIWLVGDGNNGKGTYQDMITHIIGEVNIAYLKAPDFEKEFAMSVLEGVSTVIGDDVPSGMYIEDTGNFYSVITGDMVLVNPKHKKQYSRRYLVTVIQSTNAMPKFANKSMGTYRRHHIVPFNADFNGKRENKSIKRKYIKEQETREWLLAQAFDLTFEEYITPDVSKEALEEYRADNDPIEEFYVEVILSWELIQKNTEEVKVSVDTMYNLYQDFVKKNGMAGVYSKRKFNKMLESKLDDRWEKKVGRTTDILEKDLPSGFNNGELVYNSAIDFVNANEDPNDYKRKVRQAETATCWTVQPATDLTVSDSDVYDGTDDSIDDSTDDNSDDMEQTTLSDTWNYNYDFSKDKDDKKPSEKSERMAYGKNLMNMLDK